jgi:hypothetical protein
MDTVLLNRCFKNHSLIQEILMNSLPEFKKFISGLTLFLLRDNFEIEFLAMCFYISFIQRQFLFTGKTTFRNGAF